MAARGKPVNLLPPSEFESSFWGKFLKWAVSGGRYIIIVTELIVILAFLSRFKLDKEISELNEEIQGKVSVLEAELPIEKEFRGQQRKLFAADEILNSRYQAGSTLDKLAERVSEEVKLSSVDMGRQVIKVEANSLGEQGLGQLLSGLSIDPTWKSVELSQIQEEPLTGIKFILEITL